VTALSVGTGLYLQALADDRRAAKAGTTDEFRTASQRALTLSGAGIAGFTVGSALVVGAVVRYVVVARRRPRSTTAASPFVLRVRF
ncbi:MAG: hypothetical protein KDK70_21095, partial [Myxococcales bacterium]|nr:hypothetical protein [Myxococcales bacterium]